MVQYQQGFLLQVQLHATTQPLTSMEHRQSNQPAHVPTDVLRICKPWAIATGRTGRTDLYF